MRKMVRIETVEPRDNFVVLLTFTDSTQREVDLEPYLHGPIFEPMRQDRDVFRSVHVDPRAGTIVWPNGADIDPDVLYHGMLPDWRDEANGVA